MNKKKAMAGAALLVLMNLAPSAFAQSVTGTGYADLAPTSYGAAQIEALTAAGVLHGFANGTFRPNTLITRGQWLAYMMNALQATTQVSPSGGGKEIYRDVRPGSFAYAYVNAAYQAGWIVPSWLGVKAGGDFGVNQAASTGDVASLFVAALKKAGQLTLPKGVTPLTYATQLGIFRGFNPVHGTRVTRAGAAVILENILSYANGTLLPSGETPVLTASATNVSPNSVVQLSLALRSANGQTQAIPANANVTYALDNQTGAVLDTYSGTLIVTQPGTYTVTATVDGVSVAPLIITAYAQPAGINLSSSSSTLTANGQALDTMTATIVDSTGQTVSNASGTASLSALQYGSYVDPTTGAPISSIHFVNGVATFAVKAGTTGGVSDTVSLSNVALSGTALASTFVDPSTTISYTWPSANALTLSPTTATVSDNQATEDAVSATVGGLGTSVAGLPVLAQFTLSGPASFQAGGSLMQTFSAYVVPGVPTQIPVWSLPGQSGAITLDASLSGAVVASTTISAVATGAPTALVVSSTPSTVNAMGAAQEPTLPQGSPFTLYTVSLSDAAGHAVIPATSDPLTLTDNASTVGGTLAYYAVANGQPTGPALSASQLQTAISASTGLAQFAVVTTGAGAVSPQITLHDALTGTEKTVGYAYSSGVGVYAMLTGDTPSDLNGASSSVEEGQTVTYTAQLEDPNGNPVQAAGQTIDFYFAPRGNSADVTVNGSSAWSQAAPLAVTTNAQGVASVSVTVPQGKGGEFQLVAGLPGQTSVSEVTATVGSTLYYTTGLALSSSPYALNGMVWPTAAMPLGQTLAGYLGGAAGSSVGGSSGGATLYAVPLNSAGSAVLNHDPLEIVTSNPAVLAVTPSTMWTQMGSLPVQFLGNTAFALPTITAVGPGTATLTFIDLANPTQPRITETITVGAP